MRFDPKFLDQLRSRLVLSDVIGDSVRLTKKGREYQGLCPFHKEKTPSFTVNNEKEFYHCFGCGAHGDAVRFLVESKGRSFPEAVEELAHKAGLALPERTQDDEAHKVNPDLYDAMEAASEWFQQQLFSQNAQEAQTYLERRGLSPEWVKDLGLGFAPHNRQGLKQVLMGRGFSEALLVEAGLLIQPEEGRSPYDRFRQRVMFPIHNSRGQVVAFGGRILGEGEPKYLNSPETPIFSKGHMLYGAHYAKVHGKKDDPVVVAEGYMDVIALRKAGYAKAVAPLGTALTEDQISLLWRMSFEPVLCFDGDNAGKKAAQRAADRALPLLRPGYTLKFAYLPQGEDPDTMVRSGKKTQLDQLIAQGTPLVEVLWSTLQEGKDLKAPEQQALLLKQIDQLAKRAENTTVAGTFRQALKDKFYSLRQKRPKKGMKQVKLFRPQNFFEKSSLILVAILINHPHLLDEVSEELASLEFQDVDLSNLKESILAFAALDTDYTHEALRHYLEDQGHGVYLREIMASDVVTSVPFARSQVSEVQALEGWKDIYSHHYRHQLEQEVQDLQELLANEMSETNWRRLCEVKKMLSTPQL